MLRRTLVSIAALGGFVVLAFGSGGGGNTPTADVSVPALELGTSATLSINLDNQTDSAFSPVEIKLSDDFSKAVTLDSSGGTPGTALQPGKGWKGSASGSVASKSAQSLSIDITPKVPGKFDGRISVCDASGQCASDNFTATIPGQPQDLRALALSVPETATVGTAFTMQLDLTNQGTLPDLVQTVVLPKALIEKVDLGQIQPMPGSMKDMFDDKHLSFERGLAPGETLSITIEATPTTAGGVTDIVEICGTSTLFDCQEGNFALTIQ